MRQAKIDNILYVFDKEPYALTKDTDASVIYVQQESLDGFKLLNPSLTLSPYNYSKFQVTKPVWYDAWEQEEEEGYTPEAVTPQDNIDWNIQMFSNGDRGVGLRLHSEDPTVDADRSDLQAAFESIGASNDDLIDDLVGEYDSDLAITPQALRSRKKNTRTIEEEEMTKVEVHKEGWGQYSFHSDNRMIMSVDYSDTSSDETFIDATGLSSGSDELITFSLINKQPITKRAADLSFYTQSSTVDIYDGTSSVNIDTVSNPNDLTPIVYSVDDNDLTVSVNNDNVTISNLKVGTFTITASFAGNDYYLSGSATTQLVVTSVAPKLDPQISWASASVRHNNYENPTVDIQYNNPNNLQVDFTIPLQYDDNGGYVAVDASVTGTYTLTMSYDGDDTYDAASVTCTLTIVYEEPAPQPSNYPITIDDYNLEVEEGPSLEGTIKNNVTGWAGEAWQNDVMCIVDDNDTMYYTGDLGGLYLENGGALVGKTLTVSITCASATYGGTTYNAYSDSFTLTIASAPPSYGVSLYNSNIDFDDPDTTSSDIESAIQDNLSGYDPTWMPEPTITVKYGSGDSDFICEDISMSQLDFTNSMDSITYGSTVWTVYYTIAADDHDNEHYPEENLDFTISFIVPTDDYPVTLTSDTIQVEYDAGSSSHVSEVKNAIMSNIEDYDDTWMPSIICDIYATDPNTGDDVTITEGYAIGSLDWTQEVQNAFDESGMVVPDQTEWRTTLYIASTTYNGVEYQAWDSGGYITLQFITPVVPFPNYFRLTSNQNGSTVSMTCGNSAPNISLEYTTDEGATWSQWDFSSITIDNGESVCFRGINDKLATDNSTNNANYFRLSGNINASGNIMSLLYGDTFEQNNVLGSNNTNAFCCLFINCTALYDVSDIILPLNVTMNCYSAMFYGCTHIVKAPYLPSSTSSVNSYANMFNGCSNLNYVKFNLNTISGMVGNQYSGWLTNVAATGSLVNENPNFDSTTLPAGADGLPSGWTFYSTDPQNYDASINSSNIDIYPSGDIVPYDNISEIVSDIQNNFTCNTVGATASITIPDPNDQGGSNFVIDNIELDNGADLYSAIDNYSQSYGINIGDVWTATIDIPQDTIDGTLYLDWQGTFTISFQDK